MSFTFTFGKYKGQSIEQVPEGYIQWMIDQDRLRLTTMQAELERRAAAPRHPLLEQKQSTWQLNRIISGGQTGADQGALFAASAMEIPTEGYASESFMTEEGPAEWLADFGLMAQARYRDQYGYNLNIADGTLIFYNKLTGGCSIMKELLKMADHARPWRCIAWSPFTFRPDETATWIRQHQIKRLHVAGNKESKSPGIQEAVQGYLMEMLELMKHDWTDSDKIPF